MPETAKSKTGWKTAKTQQKWKLVTLTENVVNYLENRAFAKQDKIEFTVGSGEKINKNELVFFCLIEQVYVIWKILGHWQHCVTLFDKKKIICYNQVYRNI